MTMNKTAVNTNILVYIIDVTETKHEIAKMILIEPPVISTQVVSEFMNVVRRI